jgi:hypothetical protein
MTGDLAGQVRAICLALPEVTERLSHGAPTWFVGDKRAFVTLWAHVHHVDDFPHLWCAGLPPRSRSSSPPGPTGSSGRRRWAAGDGSVSGWMVTWTGQRSLS